MKAIVSIGVIVFVAFGIFAVLSVMQRESTNKLIQEDASGFFQEKRREAEIARNGDSAPLFQRTVVSGALVTGPAPNRNRGLLGCHQRPVNESWPSSPRKRAWEIADPLAVARLDHGSVFGSRYDLGGLAVCCC